MSNEQGPAKVEPKACPKGRVRAGVRLEQGCGVADVELAAVHRGGHHGPVALLGTDLYRDVAVLC